VNILTGFAALMGLSKICWSATICILIESNNFEVFGIHAVIL